MSTVASLILPPYGVNGDVFLLDDHLPVLAADNIAMCSGTGAP